jgi:tetratricopeptide (TPR) repeat protein
MSILSLVMAVLLMGLPQTTQIGGKVLDRTGKPVQNAQVVYLGIETGRTYKFKTNSKGEFSGAGIIYGTYDVTITASDGTRIYSTRKKVVEPNTPGFQRDTNFLTADLSIFPGEGTKSGVEANTLPGDIRPGDKLTQEQKDLIRTENRNSTKINDLIRKLHTSLDVRDWPKAADILHELIAADPNRWEFYENLGRVQANQSKYQEAAQAFEKGIEVAENTIAKGSDPAAAKKEISRLMIYTGDAYSQLDNLEKALAFYSKAAEMSPEPAAAYFNTCRIQRAHGNTAAAVSACERAITLDPKRLEFYQTLGDIEANANQHQNALEAYNRGIGAARNAITGNVSADRARIVMGQMLSAEGNIYANRKKFDEAIDAFTKALEADPQRMIDYFNLCAAFYNVNKMDAAVSACAKAIASDPKMADPYFVKASALFGQGRIEHGKLQVPPGAVEALQTYLSLEPSGPHASEASAMLQQVGAPVETTSNSQKK